MQLYLHSRVFGVVEEVVSLVRIRLQIEQELVVSASERHELRTAVRAHVVVVGQRRIEGVPLRLRILSVQVSQFVLSTRTFTNYSHFKQFLTYYTKSNLLFLIISFISLYYFFNLF